MRYEDLNPYWNGLLALGKGFSAAEEARSQLIEEASTSSSLEDLLQQWVLVNDLGQPQLLQLKIWLQLSYAQLARIFRCTPREVAQWLKAQRTLVLPAYPSGKASALEPSEGLSCFMVEQYLSPWIDAEISDFRMIQALKSHLDHCNGCQDRLAAYRDLQTQILSSRPTFEAVSDIEWQEALRLTRYRQRRLMMRLSIYALLIVVLIVVGVIWLMLVPHKSPNIFELP